MIKEIKTERTRMFQNSGERSSQNESRAGEAHKSRRKKRAPSGGRSGNEQKNNPNPKSGKKSHPNRLSSTKQSNKTSSCKKPQNLKSVKDRVRVIPMGGVEEVGRNMIVIEVGDDIFLADVGFEFTDDNVAPGIDYILPNTKYLEARKNRIKAVFITHAHLDHIGGIPFIMERIGNPPIYTRRLSAGIIEKRQEEFPDRPKLKMNIVEPNSRFKVGHTFASTFSVTHSIPDATGIKIETPQGNIIISGDLKLDHNNGIPTQEEKTCFSTLGKEKNLLFIADSTNAERPGFSITEREVQENIANIIRKVPDRLIISTFASQISRMIKIIAVAKECGKKVVLEGRSIRSNLEIAQQVGLLSFPNNLIIEAKEIRNYPSHQIVILATGAQGEEFASLNRIAMGKHNDIKLDKKDTILFSSSVIPGNEGSVQALKDLLFVSDLSIMHYRTSDVHSTGHGNAGELVWINQQIGAKYFMPGYGYRSMTHAHGEVVAAAGFPKENIVIAENGTVIDFMGGKMLAEKEKVDAKMMVVDGNKVGDLQPSLMIDRRSLAESGFFNIIITLSIQGGKLKKLPDVMTCGFVDANDSKSLVSEAKKRVKSIVEKWQAQKNRQKSAVLSGHIEKSIHEFLLKKTAKKPVISVIFIEV